jgi:hypothetical protein
MSEDPFEDDRGEYDLAPSAAPPSAAPPPAAPVLPVIAAPPAGPVAAEWVSDASAPPPALAYRAPKDEVRPTNDPEHIRNLYMPLWLLGGGVAIEIAGAFFKSRDFQAGLAEIGLQLIFATPLMLIGIILAAKARQIDLGQNFWTICLKLCAIAIAPGAIVTLLSPLLNHIPFVGGLAGWVIMFCFYFALIGALFDLDQSDTWFCVCVIFLVRLFVYFVMIYFVGSGA